MYIVHVTPISRSVGKDSFSYFTFNDIPVGSVVNVPLRNREIPALVLRKENANAIKSLLRTRKYSTKNIKNPNPQELFTKEFVGAVDDTAKYLVASIGNVLNSFVPATILKRPTNQYSDIGNSETRLSSLKSYELLTIQSTKAERESSYKTILRGALAQSNSIFLLVQNSTEAKRLSCLYTKGIEKYVHVLHSDLSSKEQARRWQVVIKEKRPVLIIATRTFLSIPRKDLGVFIIDNEGSDTYVDINRPFADARIFTENLAKQLGAKLILADTLLTMRTQKKLQNNRATEFQQAQRRLRARCNTTIIDMAKYTLKAKEDREQYPVLSKEIQRVVIKPAGRIFILASRRGVAPQTVCGDCGNVVSCRKCEAPVALHGRDAQRYFLCHRCGEMQDAKTLCINCSSWRLNPLGIGIDRVENALQEVTKLPILRADSDTTKTPKKIKDVVTNFNNSEKAILLGTTMALPYIEANITTSVITSLDALLCTNNFSAEEQVFRTILKLKEYTEGDLLIQARTKNSKMLKYAQIGNIAGFVNDELELRNKLRYPPYVTFIKISVTGSKDYTTREMRKLIEILKPYNPRVFRGFIPIRGGKFTLSALVRIKNWPDDKLVTILHSIQNSFVVQIT